MVKYKINAAVQLTQCEDNIDLFICNVDFKGTKRIYQIGENLHRIILFCAQPKTAEEIKLFSISQNLIRQDQFDRFFSDFLLEKKIITSQSNDSIELKYESVLKLKAALFKPEITNILSRPLIYLFDKKFATFILLIFALSLLDISFKIFSGDYVNYTAELSLHDSLNVLILIIAGLIFHELGHAAAAYLFGCRRVEIGIGWYVYFIVFYAELSEAWKLNHKKRMIIDIAGGYFQTIFGVILWVFFLITDEFIYLKAAALLALYSAFNLNPFLRMDGYWIFSDFFQIKNLRFKALDFIHKSLVSPSYFSEHVIKSKTDKQIRVLTIYSTLMFIFLVFFCYWIYMYMLPNSLAILERIINNKIYEQFGTEQFAFSIMKIIMNTLIVYFVFVYTFENCKKITSYIRLKTNK